MLMKNTQRQPKNSVIRPPPAGPAAIATPVTVPTSAKARPRAAGSRKRSERSERQPQMTKADPTPCTARAA